ncbi:hypothetical protein BU26DRAFT_604316 [Trematosphaeria pertusa]|uniref:Uncharacterized protein n=1 Tax=Trematosphaeria pertusa TaxID=390896 RepID=A0A6A6IIP9_9PLEO|nr:uncharacterized protein BU26DRAFT_604316 [Trematosphaeria pertusa]KAF2250057.1 hypothetical protein BU26DRAFT_604316 [Trematosphaeria pertusa]
MTLSIPFLSSLERRLDSKLGLRSPPHEQGLTIGSLLRRSGSLSGLYFAGVEDLWRSTRVLLSNAEQIHEYLAEFKGIGEFARTDIDYAQVDGAPRGQDPFERAKPVSRREKELVKTKRALLQSVVSFQAGAAHVYNELRICSPEGNRWPAIYGLQEYDPWKMLRNEAAHCYGCQPDTSFEHFDSRSWWLRLRKRFVEEKVLQTIQDLEGCLWRTKEALRKKEKEEVEAERTAAERAAAEASGNVLALVPSEKCEPEEAQWVVEPEPAPPAGPRWFKRCFRRLRTAVARGVNRVGKRMARRAGVGPMGKWMAKKSKPYASRGSDWVDQSEDWNYQWESDASTVVEAVESKPSVSAFKNVCKCGRVEEELGVHDFLGAVFKKTHARSKKSDDARSIYC